MRVPHSSIRPQPSTHSRRRLWSSHDRVRVGTDCLTAPYATLILRIGLAVLFLAHAGRNLCVFKMAGSVTYFQPLGLPGWIACVTLT
jgi:hypothetical protein